jgi:hypothetical protein
MAKTKDNGESVAGYFRKVFEEKPALLQGRSNQELLEQWLTDHPGHKEVPPKVKANLQNIKSVLRKKARKRKGGRPKKVVETVPVALAVPVMRLLTKAPKSSVLEGLEVAIDDCMVMARRINSEELKDVVALLRRARNAVVWMQGQ